MDKKILEVLPRLMDVILYWHEVRGQGSKFRFRRLRGDLKLRDTSKRSFFFFHLLTRFNAMLDQFRTWESFKPSWRALLSTREQLHVFSPQHCCTESEKNPRNDVRIILKNRLEGHKITAWVWEFFFSFFSSTLGKETLFDISHVWMI